MGVISCREKMLIEYSPILHIDLFFFSPLYVFYRPAKAFNEVV